jgi:hypothetical protein
MDRGTQTHLVVEVREEVADADNGAKSRDVKKELTLEYMRKKGWERGRG